QPTYPLSLHDALPISPLDEKPASTEKSAFTFGKPVSTETTKRIPRSSERMSLRIPVVVYGFTKDHGAFHEETETQTVNSSGALRSEEHTSELQSPDHL